MQCVPNYSDWLERKKRHKNWKSGSLKITSFWTYALTHTYKALQDSHANIVTVTVRIARTAAIQYYQREDRKYKI